MLVLYEMYNSIQFGSVEDKSTTIYIYMIGIRINDTHISMMAHFVDSHER